MNPLSKLSPKKRAFLLGTLTLTGVGFSCRILGFFYRIFLSRTIGAEGIGLFSMLHPIFSICFGLCAGSIQTALSQYIAANHEKRRPAFYIGLTFALCLSLVLCVGIYINTDLIATRFLHEPRLAPYLPLIAISIPFAAIHGGINGYYYGMQKSYVPALSQIVEQILRMVFVFFLASNWIANGITITVSLAVLGHLIGEIASATFCFICYLCFPPEKRKKEGHNTFRVPSLLSSLFHLALPLMGNRLVLSLLASAEAIWIPRQLQEYGLSVSQSYSLLGVLVGMALPFILFPSAITNSIAVLLLPSVAKEYSNNNQKSIKNTIQLAVRYSMYMGLLCIAIFTMFGNVLGFGIFHNEEAGYFIRTLAWICPFLYLGTTLGSILNGLGKTRITFSHNLLALVIRFSFVIFLIPHHGIIAYLWGALFSEIILSLLNIHSLKKLIPFQWDAWLMVVKPGSLLIISIGIYRFLFDKYLPPIGLNLIVLTGIQILLLCGIYSGLLLLFHWKGAKN